MKPFRLANGECLPKKPRRRWRSWTSRYKHIDRTVLIDKMRRAMAYTTFKAIPD